MSGGLKAVVAPLNARSAPPISAPWALEDRASGVLIHVTSLPSAYGIGDVGPGAIEWVNRLHEAGQGWWQGLPLGPTGYGNSPYQCLSSFAGNGLLVSPDWLIEDGLLRAGDCQGWAWPSGVIAYDKVIPFKHRLLDVSWNNFQSGRHPNLRSAFDKFCLDQAHWLDDYALFRALKLRYNDAYYLEWPTELVRRDPAALDAARAQSNPQIDKVRFAQFLLFRQGERLKTHARAKGIRLIGDVPFFVSPDSSDVWANPELFVLDDQLRPRFVAGVPPDYFSAQGQLWGNPVYNWEALRKSGYRWYIDRLRALLAHVDVIRLDHFRGFAAAWHVPAGAPTAQNGHWGPGPGADLFIQIRKELGGLPFIAEDLGLITPDVEALRASFELPGTRVLQFAFDGQPGNPHLPQNYSINTVVYTATHDNPTTQEWFGHLTAAEQQRVWEQLRRPASDASEIAWELINQAWASRAALALTPLQDLLSLGAEGRMNVPGRAEGNWSWRCDESMPSDAVLARLSDLTAKTNRLAHKTKTKTCRNHPMSPTEKGYSSPLGATVVQGGVNFSLFSREATGVELLLFDRADDPQPSRVVRIDPHTQRTYHYWHVLVPGVEPGRLYGYRVEGPAAPHHGLRFDAAKVLLDPYGRSVVAPRTYSREAAMAPGDNAATAMKSVVVDNRSYDWEGDAPLQQPSSRTIIYELHVRGVTQHPSSGLPPETRGTYRGLIAKIPYLSDLGITAVELLPVFQFDPQDAPSGRLNYWGYAPVSFFAPHPAFSSDQAPLGPVNEFRDLVKALHRAGLEVILDVVFNHTAEGGDRGPTLNFRGVDNRTYYILERDGSAYANYSGTGNTLNANHPVVRRLIIDSLRYWVQEMHVDGFRFDLASILARDSSGHVLPNPPVLWDIETDPVLAGTKIIAEAWDAAGLYQVGSFVGDSWKEWNGQFRDDVRDFFRGAEGSVGRFADRYFGSFEIYGHERREAEQSVNFVTCHDGFTLNDLVSYHQKHNEANGEENRDGANDNRSWNCGIEGPTDDPAVESLRNRQTKNLLAATLLSLGVPMILMGDEVRRTQQGNNNAYCQDSEISWFDWSLLTKHGDIHRFVRLLNARRLLRDLAPEQRRLPLQELLTAARRTWHGVKLEQPDWSAHSRSLACTAELPKENLLCHFIWNAFWEPLDFELPIVNERTAAWRRWIDTALPTPEDIVEWQRAPTVRAPAYHAEPRSLVVLFSERSGPEALVESKEK